MFTAAGIEISLNRPETVCNNRHTFVTYEAAS